MFGKKKRIIAQQQQTIESLMAELEQLKAENQSFRERAADLERRENGIGRAISEATRTADQLIEDAQRKAGALLEQTQADCDAVHRDAEIMVDDAYRNARDIVKEAEATGQKHLDEVHTQINEYATLLNAYDKLVQEQMQMAQDSAKRFSELSAALHNAVPEILAPDGTLLIPETIREAEPEQEETPAEEAVEQETPLEEPQAEPEHDEPVEDSGEGTPLMRDDEPDFEARPFSFEPQANETAEERVWTVDEIAKEEEREGESHVEAIIDEILRASREPERE